MKSDNPLTREFLLLYPAEAARTLEELPSVDVAALLNGLPEQVRAPVMASMLPDKLIECFAAMSASSSSSLLSEMPVASAARVYSLLPVTKRDEFTANMSVKARGNIQRYLKYPLASAGTLLNPEVDMLLDNVRVDEAVRRIERLKHAVNCDIYVVNDAHHLVGMVKLGKLITSISHARLKDIMTRRTNSISVYASLDQLLSHPGWATQRRLPIVGRDNRLLGVLDYSSLLESVGEEEGLAASDPLDSLLSVAGLYWRSMAQLLDSVLNIARPEKGNKK